MSQEIQQRAQQTQAELESVEAQIEALTRSLELAKHTTTQIKASTSDADPVWQAVGRTFVLSSAKDYNETVAKREAQVKEQLLALNKKHQYYEKTLENMVKALKEM